MKGFGVLTTIIIVGMMGCSGDAPPESAKKEQGKEVEPKATAKKPKQAEKRKKAEEKNNEKEEKIEPAQKKIHPYGRALLKTRKKFYRKLKELVTNPKMPADFMKEEVQDLYELYEGKFIEHGHKIQSLGGDARGTILKVDNYITAEPMRATIWVETEANRLVKTSPDLGELLLKAYSLPRCYDFDLLRKNDPARAKRLGLME